VVDRASVSRRGVEASADPGHSLSGGPAARRGPA